MALRPTRPQSRTDQIAARDAAQNDAFLREVDDALREDEMFGAFKRYGKPIGAAVVLGLSALAGGIWWNNHREEVKAERAEKLVIALDKLESGQQDAAFADLAVLAKDGGDGSQSAARMLQAAVAARKGNVDAAVALYQAVSADSAAPKPYRDLATIREVALRFDKLKPDDVVARLKPLAAPGNPWFGSAGELLAAAYLSQGHKDLAGPLLVTIAKDKDVPDSLRARTRQLAGLLGYDAIDDIAKPSEPDAGTAGPASGQQQIVQPQPGQVQPGQVQPGQPLPQSMPVPVAQAPMPRPTVPANAGPITVNLPASMGKSAAPASSAPAAPAPAPAAAPASSAPAPAATPKP